jgi:lysozyme family protein
VKKNFDLCLVKVLAYEGGYVNHPKDPGGATNKGVTQAVYNEWRKSKRLLQRSVKLITWEEIREIYRKLYWDKVRGDELPSGVDLAVFDFAVNSGVSRAIRYLQIAVGVEVDGLLGPASMAAVNRKQSGLVDRMCNARLTFLRGLSHWTTFGRGWGRRVESVRSTSNSMLEHTSNAVSK